MAQNIVRKPDYSDLDLDFIAHPTTGDVVKKTGVDAIKRSVRNLILTNFYDRPFRSYIGSNAQKILFDNINIFTATFLRDAIAEVIRNFEPRVRLPDTEMNDNGIEVSVDPDQNGYNVRITFIIVNRGEPATINLFLERLR
jgi:phage baseplate assembly protein W